ncbi:MAG TPA: RHS repeat-associated core domain-containing protein [Candidatus Binatia bacterium]
MQVMRSLSLPDGSTYYFTYDCDSSTGNTACSSPHSQTYYYGELTSVTLPSGGVVRYTYTMFTDAYGNRARWLNSRTAGSEYVSYTPAVITTCSSGSVGCKQQSTVQWASGSTVYTFTLNNGAWPTTIVTKNASGGTLSTVNNTWDFSQPCVLIGCHGNSYVRLLSQTTTIPVAGGTNITKKTSYTYDTPQKGNVTTVKEWKFYAGTSPTFPSVPDRATYVTYYSAGNIVNKPLKTTLCNNVGSDGDCPGGGSKIKQTIVTYDSYGGNLTLVSGASNHDDANYGTGVTARGNATQIQEWVSGTTNYLTTTRQYDTTGQMLKSIDPAGNATLFSYSDAGAFYTDNGSNPPVPYSPPQITNAYLTQITLPPVASGTMVVRRGYYFGSGKVAVETDQNGAQKFHHFMDSQDRPTGTTSPATNGNLMNALNGSVIAYPSVTEVDAYAPVGDSAPSSSCTSCRHSQVLIDSFGRKSTTSLANAAGGAIKSDTTYDNSGRVASQSHPYVSSSDPTYVFETFNYDAMGRTTAVTHPDGQSLRTAYAAYVANLGGVTTQQSSTSTYGYGYPLISADETGRQRQEWIDAFGKVIEVDEPSINTSTPGSGSLTIDLNSSQVSTTFDPCQQQGHGSCPQTAYNSGSISVTINGCTASTGWGPPPPTGPFTTQSIASSLGSSIAVSSCPVAATVNGSTLTMTALAGGASTNFSFTTSSTYSTGTCGTSQCFSGPAFYASPSSGSLSGGTGGISSSPLMTAYTYDAAGRLKQVSQGVQTRAFAYDGLGRPTSIITPEAGMDTLTYDSDSNCPVPNSFPGHLVKKLDARGIRTCFQYDALGRVTAKNYSNGQGSATYQYDQGGTAAFALGRLTKVIDTSGSETYTYDTAGSGRITQIKKVVGTTTYTTSYQYNTAGQITQIVYPSGRVVNEALDNIGRLSSVSDTKGGVTTPRANTYNYNNAQQVTAFNYGNGVTATLAYSPTRDQLTSLGYLKGTQTLFSLNYFYQNDSTYCPSGRSGNNGQIDCINDGVDSGRSVAYTYDALGRALTAVTNGSTGYPKWGLAWAYDRYGNRLSQTITAGSAYQNILSFANPGGAQTNHPDGMCFDSGGNLTAESGACPPAAPMYTYDAENRMAAYAGGSAATYVYDDNGRRVEKCLPNCSSPTSRTVYIFSAGKNIAEYDNGAAPGSPSREYIYSGGTLFATLAGATTTYHHHDLLSVRVSTNGDGNKVGEQGHLPYGEAWYTTNTWTKFIFTSYERDSESGNDFAMARYYHVRFGRFCSPDPLMGNTADPQSWNRYAYARDNPISNIDPSGFSWLSSFFKAIVNFFTGAFPSSPPTIVPTFPSPNESSVWDKLADAITPPMMPGGTPPFHLMGDAASDADGGGSGGPGWAGILDTAFNVLSGTRCNNVLPFSDLKEHAGKLHFFDARTSDSPDANKKASDINPGISSKTLYELTSGSASAAALTLPEKTSDGTFQSSDNIAVGSQWNGLHEDVQQATLVHEDWHALSKKNDEQLWDVAQSKGAVGVPGQGASPNITNWIVHGCPDQRQK